MAFPTSLGEPRVRRRSLATIAVVALAIALGGCAPGASSAPSAASPSGPAGSGTAACPAAPAPPADLAGWGPPTTTPAVVPILVSSQQVCGDNRVLIGLVDANNRPIAAPDRTLQVGFYNLGRDPNQAVSTEDAQFLWAIPDERGLYVTHATFSESGVWGAEITTAAAGGQPETVRLTFSVQPTGITVAVGQPAPASKTPTLADVGGDVTKLSTDQHPDPAFYQTSVDKAVADGKPFVLVFATPKFCRSAQCGPTLDSVKPLATEFPSVTFINVEPYQLQEVAGQLQPVVDENGEPKAVPSVDEWRLTSEPWIFVVDKSGIVRGSFEGIAGADELRASIESVK